MRVSRLKDLTCVSLLLASLSPMYAPQEAAAAVPDSLAVKANTVMVSPYHASDKDLITAAVSSVGGWQLEYLPGINRTNLLNGRVTGFLGIQHDGELGIESNSMYIRGLRSISSDSRHSGGRLRAQGRQPHLPGRHRIGYDPQRRRGDRPLRSAGSERRGADHDQARPHTAPDGEHRRRGRFSGSDAPAEIPRIVRLRTSLQRSGGQRRRIAQIRPVCTRLLPQRRRPLQLSRRRLDGQIHEKILRRAALQRKRAGRHGARALLRLRRIRGQFGSLQRGQERQHL